MKEGLLIFLAIICLLACSDRTYKSGESVVKLNISFVDPEWDGKKVPKSGQCTNCGGEGLSPPLLVKNIPPDTDALIIKFRDKSMAVDHGAIRFQTDGKTELVIPSVPEQTFELPHGAEMESEHHAPNGMIPGAYMAPCGCGFNNKYVATILAIKIDKSGQKLLLGKGKIKLGRF